jgi:soluble P-type ATPase
LYWVIVPEETLQKAVAKAINESVGSKDEFLSILRNNIAAVLSEEYDKDFDDIDKKLDDLQEEILHMVIAKADYNAVADEIYRLREIKQKALSENAERQGKRQRIVEMEEFLSGQDCMVEEYDEHLVRKLLRR